MRRMRRESHPEESAVLPLWGDRGSLSCGGLLALRRGGLLRRDGDGHQCGGEAKGALGSRGKGEGHPGGDLCRGGDQQAACEVSRAAPRRRPVYPAGEPPPHSDGPGFLKHGPAAQAHVRTLLLVEARRCAPRDDSAAPASGFQVLQRIEEIHLDVSSILHTTDKPFGGNVRILRTQKKVSERS